MILSVGLILHLQDLYTTHQLPLAIHIIMTYGVPKLSGQHLLISIKRQREEGDIPDHQRVNSMYQPLIPVDKIRI
jgi:hypothetical protein